MAIVTESAFVTVHEIVIVRSAWKVTSGDGQLGGLETDMVIWAPVAAGFVVFGPLAGFVVVVSPPPPVVAPVASLVVGAVLSAADVEGAEVVAALPEDDELHPADTARATMTTAERRKRRECMVEECKPALRADATRTGPVSGRTVSYTHLTLPTNREV